MTIYRGPGGTGEARTDADITEVRELIEGVEDQLDLATAAAETATTEAAAASVSATSAAASETAAATSASNASSSASSAATSATNAASSATSASSSASAANTSATNAATSATSAASSATAAASSVSSASTSATAAAASATTASTQATNAAGSASAAASSASSASTSATNAASSASAAAISASSASASADAALAALDSFDDRYLGQKASAPSVDNDGNPLVAGVLYFNTTTNEMKVYDGATWLNAYASLSGALLATNNLSDLNNASTARTNLGLGTAATTSSSDYATAAQGTKADTAYGWGNHASAGYADDSDVVHTTGNETVAGVKTLSSNPVLSGGTANGVAYLNGSKVLTTGSALTFNGTNLGIGSNAPTSLVYAYTNSSSQLSLANFYATGTATGGAGANLEITAAANLINLKTGTSDQLAFYANASEQMRLTSTGLGIGTSSPAYSLDIQTALPIGSGSVTTNRVTGYVSSGLTIGAEILSAFGFKQGSNAVAEYAAISGKISAYNGGGQISLYTNVVSGSLRERLAIGHVGTFYLRTSGDATKTSVVLNSTTENALTLNSSGNLLVGTTSGSYKVEVAGDVNITGTYRVNGAVLSNGQYLGTAATKAIAYNAQTIAENITIASDQNGLSAGPITINTGYTVTVSTGGNWSIV